MALIAAERQDYAQDRRLLVGLLLLAFALRLDVVPVMGIHHPDELWQYLEPAYKLVTGLWVQTWDFRDGIRSWLVPMAIAPAMWVGHEIDPKGLMHVYLPRTQLAVLSLTIVWSAWTLGLRLSRYHAVFAGFIAAIWAEFIHFAPRTMSEPIAVALLFPAFVLLTEKDKRKLTMGGLLLGLAVAVRLQYAPIAALFACVCIRNRWERWPYVILGGVGALVIAGLVDLMAGEMPFRWVVLNFEINVLKNKSSEYGVSKWFQYIFTTFYYWKFASGFIIVLAGIGAKRYPALMLIAIINIVTHSFIPHKEYRFIYASSVLFVFLASIGTVDALRCAGRWQFTLSALAFLTWISSSIFLSETSPIRTDATNEAPLLKALNVAGQSANNCGLGTYIQNEIPGAYAFYNRRTPIYSFKGHEAFREFQSNAHRFNVVLTHRARASELGNKYRLLTCTGPQPLSDICVYERPGGCSGGRSSRWELNRLLRRDGD